MKITLKHPVTIDGKEITELDLKLEDLTGADIDFCARETTADNGGVPSAVMSLDVAFHARVAARAAGIDAEAMKRLKAVDYIAVTTRVQGFLLGTD